MSARGPFAGVFSDPVCPAEAVMARVAKAGSESRVRRCRRRAKDSIGPRGESIMGYGNDSVQNVPFGFGECDCSANRELGLQ